MRHKGLGMPADCCKAFLEQRNNFGHTWCNANGSFCFQGT